jgi:hypothetical protein
MNDLFEQAVNAPMELDDSLRVHLVGTETPDMQLFVGMILGALLTIGAAFVCDSSTGRAANGLTVTSAEGHAPMVNWDVVSHDLDGMKQRMRDVAVDVERGWKRITG